MAFPEITSAIENVSTVSSAPLVQACCNRFESINLLGKPRLQLDL